MSVIVPVPLNRAAALTLHVGLVAARAVESVAQAALNTERVDTSPIGESTALGMTRPRLGIKWPNDLEIDGKKIGGVLCEAAGSDAVIAGIGVNVSHDRGDFGSLDRPAGSLKSEWGVEVSRAELAIAILSRLKAVPSFARLEGEILSDLRSRNALLGRTVEGRATGGDVVVGAAQGIDTDGALLVKAGHAVVRVISGPIELSGGQTCI